MNISMVLFLLGTKVQYFSYLVAGRKQGAKENNKIVLKAGSKSELFIPGAR